MVVQETEWIYFITIPNVRELMREKGYMVKGKFHKDVSEQLP